jgi:hypothetical protein
VEAPHISSGAGHSPTPGHTCPNLPPLGRTINAYTLSVNENEAYGNGTIKPRLCNANLDTFLLPRMPFRRSPPAPARDIHFETEIEATQHAIWTKKCSELHLIGNAA